MFEEKLAQLEMRLAETEAIVQNLRQQLDAAQHKKTFGHSHRLMWGLAVLAITALGVVATGTAQGPDKKHTVKAPFVVVDAAGKPMLEVGVKGRRMHLCDSAGSEVVSLGETKEGGSSSVVLGTGNNIVGIQSETGDKKGGFYYLHDGKVTCRLGEVGLQMFGQDGKKGTEVWVKGIAVFDKAEKPIGRFGADPASEFGSLVLGKEGKGLVALVVEKDAGAVVVRGTDNENIVELGKVGVQVFNKGKTVGLLGFSPSGKGSGYLAISNPAGNAVVEAGQLPEGDGIVRAYPLSGRTPFPIPNFIRGGKSDK